MERQVTLIDMKEDILAVNLEEEASVLETFKELLRRCPDEDSEVVRAWLKSRLADAATEGEIGFYVDEFGAKDVREVPASEALLMLNQPMIWSEQSEVMLHAYLLMQAG